MLLFVIPWCYKEPQWMCAMTIEVFYITGFMISV